MAQQKKVKPNTSIVTYPKFGLFQKVWWVGKEYPQIACTDCEEGFITSTAGKKFNCPSCCGDKVINAANEFWVIKGPVVITDARMNYDKFNTNDPSQISIRYQANSSEGFQLNDDYELAGGNLYDFHYAKESEIFLTYEEANAYICPLNKRLRTRYAKEAKKCLAP